MPDEKRMIDKFEISHSFQLGAREVVVGVSPEQEFMGNVNGVTHAFPLPYH